MTVEASKQEIRRFWETNPLMTGEFALDPNSKEFFQQHEKLYRDDVFPGTGFPQSFFPFPARAEVLDVGCGPGLWTRELARRGYRVSSVDLTDTAVSLTRRSLELFGLQGDVRQGDAESLPYADSSFDGVVSHGVIHHTPDTARCVREIARVLRPGGSVVVSVYYRNMILRSRFLTRLAAFALGRLVSLPGRDRDALLRSGDPDEIVRLYDGGGNPLGKSYTGSQFEQMFRDAGLTVTGHERFYFPARAFGQFGRAMKPIQPKLARRFGLMYTVFARKPISPKIT